MPHAGRSTRTLGGKSKEIVTPTNLAESVAAVCRAASRLRRSGRPPITLFWFTGHRRFREQFTENVIAEELRRHPELIHDWRLYSADKRYSPAWYFDEQHDGSWVVGYYHAIASKRIARNYSDQAVACANFILREMGKELVDQD